MFFLSLFIINAIILGFMHMIGALDDPLNPLVILLLINVPAIILKYTYFSLEYRVKRHVRRSVSLLVMKDGSGFTLIRGTNKDQFLWQELQEVTIKDNLDLVLEVRGKSYDIAFQKVYSYFNFLKAIPADDVRMNEARRAEIFNKLELCQVCGYRSRIANKCYECFSFFTGEGYDNAVSDEDNLKELQLTYLADEMEAYEPSPYDETIPFGRDPAWEPLVSEKEVKAYLATGD